MQLANQQQFLQEDQAFLLNSRGVIRLQGEQAVEAIQPLITTSLDKVTKKTVFAHILDNNGFLMIDLFIVSHNDDLLIETDKAHVSTLLELLSPRCETLKVTAQDVSADWLVFARLPGQETFNDGSEFISYTDPRWHMGARQLRSSNALRSSQWGSEIKWATHAIKLGFLPCTTVLQDVVVTPLEAGLHAMNLLDSNTLPEEQQATMSAPRQKLSRRLLPMRIEPNSSSFPTMAGGLPILAGDVEIGEAVCHHGLFALALVKLEPWRNALATGTPLFCAGQSVLITWPSWLAQESCGRGGPVAMLS